MDIVDYQSSVMPQFNGWDFWHSLIENDEMWSELSSDLQRESSNNKSEAPKGEELLEDLYSSLLVGPDDLGQQINNNPLCVDQCQQSSTLSASSSTMYLSESSCSIISPRDKNEKKKKNKEEKKNKYEREMRVTRRFAFKPKSEKDSFEDGYKWRKYGKKMLRSTPFPRNYYKCMDSGCHVKKRVEQDQSNPSLVNVTYEGKHNHHSPFLTYYIDDSKLFSQPGSKQTVFLPISDNFHV